MAPWAFGTATERTTTTHLALRRKQDDLDATQARLQGQNERTSRLKGELVEKNQRIEEKNRGIATLSREMEKLETKIPLRNCAGQRWFTASCLRQGGVRKPISKRRSGTICWKSRWIPSSPTSLLFDRHRTFVLRCGIPTVFQLFRLTDQAKQQALIHNFILCFVTCFLVIFRQAIG